MNQIDKFLAWCLVQVRSLSIFINFNERLERLEAATYHGQKIHTIQVPEGMGIGPAWKAIQNGTIEYPEGKPIYKAYVLTDSGGNLLRAFP